MKIIKVFFDTEFTNLNQSAQLASLGMISENGFRYYSEITDLNLEKSTDFFKKNVMPKMIGEDMIINTKYPDFKYRGEKKNVATSIAGWLIHLKIMTKADMIEFWGDCLPYDWVLLCELFGGAEHMPKFVSYIPMDICTMLNMKGYDPDLNRCEFAGVSEDAKHNALNDAEMIKCIYEKLIGRIE